MKPFIQDGHSLALRAVRDVLGADPPRLVIEAIETVDWASATFVGKRHRFELRIEGAAETVNRAVERLLRDLPEVDVAACGYFLAEIALEAFALTLAGEESSADLTIGALTIEE